MTDAEWAALTDWEKDLWEMKHLPEKDRLNSIEEIVMWLPVPVEQRDQRRSELLDEVLRFGEPTPSSAPTSPQCSIPSAATTATATTHMDISMPSTAFATFEPVDMNSLLAPSTATLLVRQDALRPSQFPGAISVPPSTALGEMNPVVVTPATCSTMSPDHNSDGQDPAAESMSSESVHTFLGSSSEDSPSPPLEPWYVVEQVRIPPITCSAECFASNISMLSLGFSTTRAMPSILLPAAASALSPELIVQVQVPPSTLSTVSVHVSVHADTPTPTKCLTIGTYSLLLLLPPVALDTIDTTMTERQYIYEDGRNFVQKVTEITATLVCFSPLLWHEKQIWPPLFSLNVLAFNLQVYEQQNKCRLLDIGGYTLFEQSNNSKDTIHVHAALDADAQIVADSSYPKQIATAPEHTVVEKVLMHELLCTLSLLDDLPLKSP